MKNYKHRLEAVIPGGAHTYSRGSDQFPQNAPEILVSGQGCKVIDSDGREFIDYGMALRAVTLGYANPSVNAAAIDAISKGNNLTRASVLELEAAEKLVSLMPHVDMVKFAKNGSNVTTAALKLARAKTQRNIVLLPVEQPFFSFDDWFIGSTVMDRGVDPSARTSTLRFTYGDLESVERLFKLHPGQVCAVMMEAATTQIPCPSVCGATLTFETPCRNCAYKNKNFLHEVQEMCRREGALFILDEMITGFRWDLRGATNYFGLDPDLVTYGKGMANGFSVAAIAGKKEIMQLGSINEIGEERTFLLSSTHGGEMSGLAAFLATVNVYENEPVVKHLWEYGHSLAVGMTKLINQHGLEDYISVDGPDISLAISFTEGSGENSPRLRTLFLQEMVSNGVLMPWIAISYAHDAVVLEKTLIAFDRSLGVLANALVEGIEKYLVGEAVKPVFRRYN